MKTTMKKHYEKPSMKVFKIGTSHIICASGDWDVIPPGPTNDPPG